MCPRRFVPGPGPTTGGSRSPWSRSGATRPLRSLALFGQQQQQQQHQQQQQQEQQHQREQQTAHLNSSSFNYNTPQPLVK